MYPTRPASGVEAVNQFRISRQSEPGHHENSGDGKISVNPERNKGVKGGDSGDRRAGWQTGRQAGWQASRAEGAGFRLRLKELPVKGKSLPLPPFPSVPWLSVPVQPSWVERGWKLAQAFPPPSIVAPRRLTPPTVHPLPGAPLTPEPQPTRRCSLRLGQSATSMALRAPTRHRVRSVLS